MRTGLAHADDAAAANLHARRPHMREGLQALFVGAGRHDSGVVFGCGVEVVVVEVETSRFQRARLFGGNHAEGGAGLQSEALDPKDHPGQLRQVAVLQLPPSGAHAEALSPMRLRPRGVSDHGVGGHQLGRSEAGLEMS